jgi:hypothetical protein
MADLASLLSTAVRPSQNVQSYPVNWPAFMAEQLRNIPTLGESNPGPVPPPMAGQLGQLLQSAGQRMTDTALTSRGPTQNYVIPNPDQPPYDPTAVWNMQHR